MAEIRVQAGPLGDDGLRAIAGLYGRTDPKYAAPAFLRHLFVDNPFGWSLHAFAYDGDTAVGHCAAIPLRAHAGSGTLMSGKVEAYFVDERYRRSSGRPVALELLVALSDAAEERGIDPLHAYVSPRVGAIFERAGYRAHVTGARAHVLVSSAPGGPALRSLAAVQNTLAAVAGAGGGHVRTESPADDDASLVEPAPRGESWTIAGSDSWAWFVASGFLSAVELPGGRALVAHQGPGQPLHLLGWRGRSAVAVLAALARTARERSASTVRVQPWSAGDDRSLLRACRLLALAPRPPLTVYVRPARSPAPAPSPFFYATF